MARFSDAKGRRDGNSGYGRAFGNKALGQILSRAQATVISTGNELEKLVSEKITKIEDLDEFLARGTIDNDVYIASKRAVKKSQKLNSPAQEPDFLVFRHSEGTKHCYAVELKDGDTFDTKKAEGEYLNLVGFVQAVSQNLPYVVSFYFVAFNQEDKNAIYEGFKKKVPLDKCLTGREFCELLEIDYDEIVAERGKDAQQNFQDFLTAVLEIEEVRDFVHQQLSEGSSQ